MNLSKLRRIVTILIGLTLSATFSHAQNKNYIIPDATTSVNCLLKHLKCTDTSLRLRAMLSESQQVFYNTDRLFLDVLNSTLIRWVAQTLRSEFLKITAGHNSKHLQIPKIIFAFEYDKAVTSTEIADYSRKLTSLFISLAQDQKDQLQLISAFTLTPKLDKHCSSDSTDFTVLVQQDAIADLLSSVTVSRSGGVNALRLVYLSSCNVNEWEEHAVPSEINASMTGLMVKLDLTVDELPLTYDKFEEWALPFKEKTKGNFTSIFIITLYENENRIQDKLLRKYRAFLYDYVEQWAMTQNRNVILEDTEAGLISNITDVLSTSISFRDYYPEPCTSPDKKFSEMASVFKKVILPAIVWPCWETILMTREDPMEIMILIWKPTYQMDEPQQIYNNLSASILQQPRTHRVAIVFDGPPHSEVLHLNKGTLPVGHTIQAGKLALATAPKIFDMLTMWETGNSRSLFDFYILDLELDYLDWERNEYHYNHLTKKLLKQLSLLSEARQEFMKAYPGKDVLFNLYDWPGAWSELLKRWGNAFCDSTVLKFNQYYEAIVTWARVHNVTVILRELYGIQGDATSPWHMLLKTENLEDNKTDKIFPVMRNYPSSLSNHFPLNSCVPPTEKRETKIAFEKELTGVTVNLNIFPTGLTINAEGVNVMLQYALHKFGFVEVVFGPLWLSQSALPILEKAIDLVPEALLNGTEILIEIPFPSNQGEIEKWVGILNKKSKENRTVGLHFFGWGNRSKNMQEMIINLLEVASKPNRKVRFGLSLSMRECITETNLAGDKPSILQSLNYIVCEMPSFASSTPKQLTPQLTEYLDKLFVIKSTLEKLFPQLRVYFRVTSLHTERDSKNTRDYYQWVSDVNAYCKTYNVAFLIAGFDQQQSKINGWWRVDDYSDLADPNVYNEKESETLHFHTWRPVIPSSLTKSWTQTWLIVFVVILLVSLALLTLILVVKMRSRSRVLTEEDVKAFLKGVTSQSRSGAGEEAYICSKFDEKYALSKSDFFIDISTLLGMGNFGTVFKAVALGREAAVKQPNSGCSKESFKSMLNEVKVMSYIGKHENVIEFIGCYVKEIDKGVVYIASEFCSNGSLLSFLRNKAATFTQTNDNTGSVVDTMELIKMAHEIACGMEYIASKSVIHGDLSARNVLLDEFNNCKIGDFGLSRKLYEYNKYVKQSQEPLPWRWMAPEALVLMEFTTMSDVWSYGITLWEIFTLGGTPYPGLAWTVGFADELKNGLCLPKADQATPEIHELITKCCQINPMSRPLFHVASKAFLQLRNTQYSVL